MDPLTILGGVAASFQLLSGLQSTAFDVIELYRGVRDINETTLSIHDQLEAFQYVLFLLTNEASRLASRLAGPSTSSSILETEDPLRNVLANANKTFIRLEEIFKDISQSRKVGAQLRRYFCARSYDSTLRHLRERLIMYVQILNIALTMTSTGHRTTSGGTRTVFVKVLTNHVDLMEEAEARLIRDASQSMPDSPSTPPTSVQDQARASLVSLNKVLPQPKGQGESSASGTDSTSSQDPTLVSESLELIGYGKTMTSSIKDFTSTMYSESGAPTVTAGSDSGIDPLDPTPVNASILHPESDAISLHPIFSRRSRETVSNYVDQLEIDLQSGLGSSKATTEHDGVPTKLDQHVFKTALAEARKHSNKHEYGRALAPLEVLLRKMMAFGFLDVAVEKEVLNLTATALLQSGSFKTPGNNILRLYPFVLQELVVVVLEKVKVLSSTGATDEAILQLDPLLSCLRECPQVEVSLNDDPMVVSQTIAVVDYQLVEMLSATALHYENEHKSLKNRPRLANSEARKTKTREMIAVARRAIDGWTRVGEPHKLVDAEETVSQLTIALANLLTDIDMYDQEGEEILVRFTKDQHLDVKLRAKAERVLAAVYLRQADDWGLSRQHAEMAVRLYTNCQNSRREYATSIELFIRACELLGDPEGTYAGKELPKKWKRDILPADMAITRISQYIAKLSKDDPDKALATGLEFLKNHYDSNILDPDGNPSEPCWACISLSMKDSACSFLGHLGPDEACPGGKCTSTSRYPVLEFLASAKPVVPFSSIGFLDRDFFKTIGLLTPELVQPPEQGVSARRLLRRAIVNGNGHVVQYILNEAVDSPISDWIVPNQVDQIKHGDIRLAQFVPGVRYKEVFTKARRTRSVGEMDALRVLIRMLSSEGLHTTVDTVFMPGSVWDNDVLAMVLSRFFELSEVGGELLKDYSLILVTILRNAMTYISKDAERKKVFFTVLRSFTATAQKVKASKGAHAWSAMLDRIYFDFGNDITISTPKFRFLQEVWTQFLDEMEFCPAKAASPSNQ